MYCGKFAVTEFILRNGSGPCQAGYYCKLGVNSSQPDPPLSSGVGGRCPAGFYCPEGTDEPKGCLIGTYSKDIGLKNETECTPCDYGDYCDSEGQNATSGMFLMIYLKLYHTCSIRLNDTISYSH